MPVQQHSVVTAKPLNRVFDYVTTPAWWPIYHPSSKVVDKLIDQDGSVSLRQVKAILESMPC
jgi:hypothetical protein